MPHRVRTREPLAPDLDFGAIRAELGVPGAFPPEVLDAAADAVRSPELPDHDRTDLDLVTIDPAGSTDLDQAIAVERRGDGWRVHYAIADVAAFVRPGDPVDREARRRTQTYYAPDERAPLHPEAIGEAAGSLLPDGPRPAALWTIDVAGDGSTDAVDVRRAMVRSRAQLTYAGVQATLDRGDPPASLRSLPELGAALLADARRRRAIDLGLPEQEVERGADGRWTVALRRDLPVETWNAHVSLLTGRAAAELMIAHGVGILRTLPPPDPDVEPRLRAAAANLSIDWPADVDAGAILSTLDHGDPRAMAFADLAAELLRGAAYTAFHGPVPTDPGHAGVGGRYAHATAPLRRLVDRFTTEICLAVSAGRSVPDWVLEAFDEIPALMADGDRLAKKLDRAVIDAAEAFVLSGRVGEVFPAEVVETGRSYGTIVLDDPPVWARCDAKDLPLGGAVHVRLVEADVTERSVRFERVS
ncbi:MAG: RNB domain-containing ribonuclease [Actinobacteria bacterium]|nr:RNB domain-containing ribonuclease [Actinomycetota bacterium]